MYDARGPSSTPSGNSNMIFGVLTVLVVTIAFFGVLFFPMGSSGSGALSVSANESVSDHPILVKLNDSRTASYIQLLESAAPKSARLLSEEARIAVNRGAGEDELAMLMLSTYDEGEFQQLVRADIRHIDEMSGHLTNGLRSLSRSNSKWCKASHYQSMSNANPALMLADLGRALSYGSEFYNWALDFNMIVLSALEDATENPKSYGSLTQSDEAVLQRAMMGLIANPQFMQLMMLQGPNSADTQRALANVNICQLGLSLQGVYTGLPRGTRERMWGEVARQLESGNMRQSISGLSGF